MQRYPDVTSGFAFKKRALTCFFERENNQIKMNNIACSICLESLTLNRDISSIPCGHVFHYDCISKWIGNGNPHCSICRNTCPIEKITKLFFSESDEPATIVQNALLLNNENQKLRKELQAANKRCIDIQEEKLKLSNKQREDLAFKDRIIKNLEKQVKKGSPYQNIQNPPSRPKEPQVGLTLVNTKSDEELCLKWLKANYKICHGFGYVHWSNKHESMYKKYLDAMRKLGNRNVVFNVVSKCKLEVCVMVLFEKSIRLVEPFHHFSGIQIRQVPLPLSAGIAVDWQLFKKIEIDLSKKSG